MINRRITVTPASALLVVAALLACKSGGEKLPADVPVYPGAEEKTNMVTVGIHNVLHQTQADGATVKAWYDTQLASAWKPRLVCGNSWRQRRKMLNTTFENRCFKHTSRDEYLQIEVASTPGNLTSIRTRSCPGNRQDRCAGKP